MTGLRSIVAQYHRAFNARDWDAWTALLDEDVEVTIDAGTLRGADAARARAVAMVRQYPGLRAEPERVVAERGDTIVVEYRFVNPTVDEEGWHLGGLVCAIFQARGRRIVAVRSYHAPTEADRTDVVRLPSRVDAARMAEEQVALRRVATLVADGVPPGTLFGAVTEEVGRLFGADLAGMIRFEGDETIVAVAAWAAVGEHANVSGRWTLDGDRLATRILTTAEPTREDAWAEVGGPIAAFIREELGIHSSVGSPIAVEGRVWGALFVHSTQPEPLPEDTEARLGHFTQLVATAMANVQARAELQQLAEEQAALRRVAELVARGAAADEVFATVAEELGKLTRVEGAKMLRYERDETATFVASWGELQAGIPVGTRLSYQGNSVTARIIQTGQAARVEDYANAEGRLASLLHREGMASAVGAPIVVDGRIWGALLVGSVQIEPLPAGTEEQIGEFAELVATAIANLEARAEVERLADEQSALRRVAELVARESPADRVFAAVAQEVGTLLGVSSSAVLRFAGDETVAVMAAWGAPDVETRVGQRLSCPVIVQGRPWGAIVVSSPDPEPLPADTEERVEKFTELVATSIANVEARADLAASRARVVAASDEARRRIERDLHDGVQQRLVSLSLAVRGVQTMFPADLEAPREQLTRVTQGLADVLEELRELSHGLHPAILSQGGLEPALRALSRRSAVPIRLECSVPGRLDEPVEAAAYYVVSEALANAAKHAHASRAEISVEANGGLLDLTIRDDGIGRADPARGSGLIGLGDRVAALGGRIEIASPPDQGTSIHVELPLGG